MTTLKNFPHSHLRLVRVQRQMTSLIPLPRVEDHLGTNSDHIKFLLSMTPVW